MGKAMLNVLNCKDKTLMTGIVAMKSEPNLLKWRRFLPHNLSRPPPSSTTACPEKRKLPVHI